VFGAHFERVGVEIALMQTQIYSKSADDHFGVDRQSKQYASWLTLMPVAPYPTPAHNDRLNSADLHQSQKHPLAKVG